MENIKIKIQNQISTVGNDGKTMINISANNLTFTPDVEDEGFTNYGVCKNLPSYCITKEVSKNLDDKIRKLLQHLRLVKYDDFIKHHLLSYFDSIVEDTYYLNSLKLIDKYEKLILSPYFQEAFNIDISIIPMINKLRSLKNEFHEDIKDIASYTDFNKSRQNYYTLDSNLPFTCKDDILIPYTIENKMESLYSSTKLSHGVELSNLRSSNSEWFTIIVYSSITDQNTSSEYHETLRPCKGLEMTSQIRLISRFGE